MNNSERKEVHPYMVWNRREKIKAKIGKMVMDMVNNNFEGASGTLEVTPLKENVSVKYGIHVDTLYKYVGENITEDEQTNGNRKKFVLSKNEVIATREILYILGRYEKLSPKSKNIIKLLFSAAGKTL